jgi:hypothetical protein
LKIIPGNKFLKHPKAEKLRNFGILVIQKHLLVMEKLIKHKLLGSIMTMLQIQQVMAEQRQELLFSLKQFIVIIAGLIQPHGMALR